MRELHAIGLTPDGQHLLLGSAPDAAKASHRIAVDQHFEAVLRGQRVDDPTSGPSLSVQDMQARLRSGATVEEVAAAAGLPVSRVERFAGPVFSERESVLTKIFAAHQNGRRGHSTVPLGRAIAIGLEDVANVRLDTVEWTAYRKADGVWVGRMSVFARGRIRRAEWSLDDANRTVRPLDAWASSLGHLDDTVKPPPAITGAAPAAPARPAKKTAPKAGVAKAVPAKQPASRSRGRMPVKAPAKTAAARAAKSAPTTVVRVKAPAAPSSRTARATLAKVPAAKVPAAKVPAAKVPAAKVPAAKLPAVRATPAQSAPVRAMKANPVKAAKVPAARATTVRPAKVTPVKGPKVTPVKGAKVTPLKAARVTPAKALKAPPARASRAAGGARPASS